MIEASSDKSSPDLPPIPPVLMYRPRKVRVRSIGSAIGMWFTRLFILPHSIAGLVVAGIVIGWPLLVMFGTDYPAQVTHTRYYTSSGKKSTVQHFEVSYKYSVGGEVRSKSADVDEATFTRVGGTRKPAVEQPAYGTVTVRGIGVPPLYYDTLQEKSGSFLFAWLFMILWATIWNGVMCAFWYGLYIQPWRMRRLYRNGNIGFGVITEKYLGTGKSRTAYFKYKFFTETGLAGEGKMTVPDRKAYEAAKVGENVIVLHRDGKTKPSVIYEYGAYRCVE